MGKVSRMGNNTILSVTGSVVAISVGGGEEGVACAQPPRSKLAEMKRELIISKKRLLNMSICSPLVRS
jgi:hypothetical protein